MPAKVEMQTLHPKFTEDPMTEERMALVELLQKSGGDGDFLRAVAEAVLQILMEADVEGLIGAGRHERTGDRPNYRKRLSATRHPAPTQSSRRVRINSGGGYKGLRIVRDRVSQAPSITGGSVGSGDRPTPRKGCQSSISNIDLLSFYRQSAAERPLAARRVNGNDQLE